LSTDRQRWFLYATTVIKSFTLVQTKPTGLGYRQLEISEVVLISTGDPVNIVILAVSLSVTTLPTITAITIAVLVFAVTRGVIT
jgi:hypothetical protein